MTCSRCGRRTPGSSGRCVSCGAILTAAETAANGVRPDAEAEATGAGITPFGADADATRLGADTPFDPDATRLGVTVPPPEDADATHLGFAAPSPDDPDATRLGITTPPPEDDDATRLGLPTPPPVTRPRTSSAAGTRGTGGARQAGDAAADLVGKPLGARYQILKLLGAGGMGAVYEAWDQELGVVVALKTVRPEIAADPETARVLERRFKQELLLARQVTHKNIVRVHDMGEVDGIKYITMPYLAGEDLASVLKREGKLPVRRVMGIARQVASGLAAAHEAGVVHRDLKPANIMMAGDDAMIMDFGVARSTGGPKSLAASGPEGQVLLTRVAGQTSVGSVVGTIEYMAPEQARAQPVDQRADIYAFGLILYDLLLGRVRASRTESVVAELNLRMKEPPPPPHTVDATIPEALDRIITKCVQTKAEDRYASTADLVSDLDKLDDDGKPLPIIRRLTWRIGAAAAVVVTALIGATYWLAQGPAVPVERDAVSVLIADVQNRTGEEAFDGTLEQVLRLSLEDAGFINAYDRSAIRRSLGVRPPDQFDENAALELAVKQGVHVVLSGSIERQGSRYAVSVKATQAVTGTVVTSDTERASSKEQVIEAASNLAETVREALGDDTSGSARRFAMETLSATSLEAVHEYARGLDALSRSRFEDALQSFSKAIALDADFGSAYAGMAITSRNLDRHQDTAKYLDEALKHTDSMTEREVYRTRGFYYLITDDYQPCVKEYGDLIAKYSADVAARNNRAVCLTQLRRVDEAVAEMKEVVKVLPRRVLYRQNLALYAAYNGDADTATQEIDALEDPGLFGLLARAFSQMLQSKPADALATYVAIEKLDEQAASYAAAGRGDVAIYEGRYADASRILTDGAAADIAAREPDRAANKLLALAHAEILRQRRPAAIAAVDKALEHSRSVKTRFLAARVFAEAGVTARATALATELSSEVQATPRAYGKIIEGLLSLEAGDAPKAIQALTEGTSLLDTWIGHYDLGRAYLEAGLFRQAESEFDRCISRRGEALSLFLDEEPSYGFLPPVYYYHGRVQEGLKSAKAADSFRTYLQIRGTAGEDSLVADARKRAGL